MSEKTTWFVKLNGAVDNQGSAVHYSETTTSSAPGTSNEMSALDRSIPVTKDNVSSCDNEYEPRVSSLMKTNPNKSSGRAYFVQVNIANDALEAMIDNGD